MIYDLLTNIGNYKGIRPNLDTAIDFIMKTDLNTLPMGKTEIAGDKVFINVMEAMSHPLTEDSYELHRVYMDIQIDLKGCEIINTALEHVTPVGDYAPDFQKARASTDASCTMGPGRFIICMKEEAHAPGGCKEEAHARAGENQAHKDGSHECGPLKKCVVKVAWD